MTSSATSHFQSAHHGVTTLHPLGLSAVMACGVALLVVPRRYAVWPMIVMACFIPSAQRLVVFTLDFDLLRILVLFGSLRVVLRGEYRDFNWQPIDWAIVAYTICKFTLGFLRGGSETVVYLLGTSYDIIGMFFLFRLLVRNWDDVKSVVYGFSIVALPVACAFAVERATGRNVFAMFGGVSEFTPIRDERLRCQGAFSHPILAGVFWASLLPLFFVQAKERGVRRGLGYAAMAASLLIIFSCNSATPLTSVMFAVIGGLAFYARHWMRAIRWGFLAMLIALHFMMQAPVWHLISRIDLVGGSGYHRYVLVNGAIRHMHEWWLMGSRVGSAHWGHFTHDVTNAYVVQALHGGFPLLGLFIAVIACAFAVIGTLWRANRPDRVRLLWSWALGVSLFVHVTSFLGIVYFGQTIMLWYLLLAMIGSLGAHYAPVKPRVATVVHRTSTKPSVRQSAPSVVPSS